MRGETARSGECFEAIGHEVLKLKREEYAFLNLAGLKTGEKRELTPHEVKRLRALAEHGKAAF